MKRAAATIRRAVFCAAVVFSAVAAVFAVGPMGQIVGGEGGSGLYSALVDFDGNGSINHSDLSFLTDNWLWRDEDGSNLADVNGDGFVNFADFAELAASWLATKRSVAIFVDADSYSSLKEEIERLRADISRDLKAHVFVFSDNWESISRIKDILVEKYNQDGLIGSVLIGEIPTAYFEYQNAGSTPSDWYFQDMSDKFVDSDGDGKFEKEYYRNETDVTMRDVWTGRIKPPVGGSEGIELLRKYLDRNHDYRIGRLSYDRKMLYFGSVAINQTGTCEEDYNNLVDQIREYTGLYDSDEQVERIYDSDMEVQKQQYLSSLSGSHDFVFVNIHGSATTQWLGGSTNIYHHEIIDAKPEALFTYLASCSNGDFTKANYLAGWQLFGGNGLAVLANSIVTMLVGASSPEFLKDYIPLGVGANFGSICMNDRSYLVTNLMGDPTLTLRPKPTGDLPELVLSRTEIAFGDVQRGAKPADYLLFENKGMSLLKITYHKARSSIDGEWPQLDYWDVFYYKDPDTGSTFRSFEVQPGQSKTVPFTFYPRADGPTGRYSMIIVFQTNDPASPYLSIKLSGTAI